LTIRTVARWFAVSRVDDGLIRIVEPYVDPLIRCNIWHIRGRDHDLLIDTGLGLSPLRDILGEVSEREPWVMATHTHFDHVGGMHEFETRIAHPGEATFLSDPGFASIRVDDFPQAYRAMLVDASSGGDLLTAYPADGFNAASFETLTAVATRLVEEGGVIDLGDRAFTVLHLPGHSPGSIGLWEAASGTLFAGDAIYDGQLLDDLPGSNRNAYALTMERLRALPVTVVHGGHGESFGKERMLNIIDAYLAPGAI
jgi:glyoxylase-like metal-dependent hydrolase (beta-lactamase superfamily II)